MPAKKKAPLKRTRKSVKGKERRSVPRIVADQDAVEIYDSSGENVLGLGYLFDVGIDCAGLRTSVKFSKSQKFFMRFFVQDKYIIGVWAQVKRKLTKDKKFFYGVKFSKIDLIHKNKFEAFIKDKLK